MVALGLQVAVAAAQILVVDDAGRRVTLSQPAKRIVSLAPHITEMLFSAGAGATVVGVVSYSDYPPEATEIAQVGSYDRLDLERIVALKPGLIIGWRSGKQQAALAQLQQRAGTQLLQAFERDFSYPLKARRKGWQGEVLLAVRLSELGAVEEVRLLQTSGYQALDRAALQSMRNVERIEWLAPQAELSVEVPVSYRLVH